MNKSSLIMLDFIVFAPRAHDGQQSKYLLIKPLFIAAQEFRPIIFVPAQQWTSLCS